MYELIRGTLLEKDPAKAVVDACGVGYRLRIHSATCAKLPATSSQVLLYLSHIVREDSEELYAFLTKEERDLFEIALTVSGIGPKTALALVGHMSVSAFQQAILTSDSQLLSKTPGIGKKTAERLVVEMRDKFKTKGAKGAPIFIEPASGLVGLSRDALGALINLGYALPEAQRAVTAALERNQGETDLGRLIAAALQRL